MTGIQASRAVYYTRRKATPTGRREIRKWARSAIWLAGFIAYTAWTARNGLIELQPDAWAEAYDQITATNPGTQTTRCAATTAAAIWAAVAASSLAYIVRRRPWRPHSGGLHICSPVWNLPRPRTHTIAAPYFPPLDHHTPLLPGTQQPESSPTPEPAPQEASHQPARPEPDTSPEPTAIDRAGGQAPETPPPRTAAREDLIARADGIKARCEKVFNLYSANTPTPPIPITNLSTIRGEAQSLLAVLIAAGANRAKTDEVAGILRTTAENARSLLRRAEKDGWVVRESPADWAIAPTVKTDFGLLVDAVDNNDETAAEAIAATIGPPLPSVQDEWLDQLIADPTPRKELRLAAADILTTAAEQWPQNPAWLAATDRLYGD